MSVLRVPSGRAVFDEGTVVEAMKAIVDGEPRQITLGIPGCEYTFTGYVWEVYRSIVTASIRIRVSDDEGRVYHFNSMEGDLAP